MLATIFTVLCHGGQMTRIVHPRAKLVILPLETLLPFLHEKHPGKQNMKI